MSDRRSSGPTKRGARTWRDETNPAGPTDATGEAPSPTETADPSFGPEEHELEHPPVDDHPGTAGAGGGGATQWSGAAKRHEGLHGAPTRKP